ncbi:actin bundling protein [Reticulomyxa filosa]|uniref:Actin bundling protein n=1 Tax=Reticulomyxa filosa TaxID=46433 RepID=X6MP66_RETFI|nr:actin bundling protein [Reticulomyxa filosa]|eukprot:ETO15237.1 actin bundling protein [Reticulomyxa filosa]
MELIAIESKSGGLHSYAKEEISAFANHLNYCLGDDPDLDYLLPINPDTNDLFMKVKDGVIIAKFINVIEPETIDWRAVNYKKGGGLNQFKIIENQNLNISAAKSIGTYISVVLKGGERGGNGLGDDQKCLFLAQKGGTHFFRLRVQNQSAEELRDAEKNPTLVLGFMWQAVKMQLLGSINLKAHPELIRLLQDGEEMNDLLALPPEEILKRWVNYHLAKENYPKRINNFGTDIKDAKVYTVLLKSISGGKCDADPLNWGDTNKRAQKVLDNASAIGEFFFCQAAEQ